MWRWLRPSPGGVFIGLGVCWAVVSVLDPLLSSGRLGGPLLAAAGFLLERRRRGATPSVRASLAVALALALGVAAAAEPFLHRADFPTYFAFLRSLAFDGDLDFANEWRHWGFKESPLTPTGHRFTQGSIGPALLWAPFFAMGDALVRGERLFGVTRYAADGYSAPYARSAIVGTVFLVVLGLYALGRVLARSYSRSVTGLALLATFGATPLVFYTFVMPGMAHGMTFALACFAIFLADRREREVLASDSLLLGLVLGLLVAVRLQAVVLFVFLLPFFALEWRRDRRPPRGLALLAGGAFVAFLPQMLAWKAIYGRFITLGSDLETWSREAGVTLPVLFRPGSWFDPRSLHFWDVLFSAERGFFNWTPLCLVGVLGLLLALRRTPLLAGGGILAFLATAWWNGSLAGFEGADAFGARRFDLVLPFVALGVAATVETLSRRPLLAPSLALLALVLWNAGFIRLWRQNQFTRAAPLGRLAERQAVQAEELTREALGAVMGPRGRAAAWNTFEGEYMYWNLPEDGRFEMGKPDLRYLAGGWSEAVNRTGPPQYRTAFHPRACLRFPLMVGVPLRASVTAKRPARLAGQTLGLELNGRAQPAQPLAAEWSDLEFELPQADALPGENTLCLVFSAGATRGDEEERTAARVRRVHVRSLTTAWPNPLWGLYGLGR